MSSPYTESILDVARSSILVEHASTMGDALFLIDPTLSADEAVLTMGDFDCAPVNDEEGVHRYVLRVELESGSTVDDCARPIDALRMLHGRTPLMDGLRRLEHNPAYFILERSGVEGIFTVSDLQRTAVSMTVFSTVLGIEHAFKALVRRTTTSDEWLDALDSESRSEIELVYQDRRRHGVEIDLLDCMTTTQKTNLVWKLGVAKQLGYTSNTQWARATRPLRKLRNPLAHGNSVLDVGDSDPQKAVALVVGLDDFAFRLTSVLSNHESAMEPVGTS